MGGGASRGGAGQREGQREGGEGGTCRTSSFPVAATPRCQLDPLVFKRLPAQERTYESKFTDVKRIYFLFLFCNLGR